MFDSSLKKIFYVLFDEDDGTRKIFKVANKYSISNSFQFTIENLNISNWIA